MARIMIIDDDFDILRYCDSILSVKGHEVITRTSPKQALETLNHHNVDLLVVDVVMPEMSGFDVLKTVRDIPHFHAPILMLTGRSAAKDVQTALELGATDYMVKPFDRDVFFAKIQSILGTHATGAEVKFASGSTKAKAEVTFPCLIDSVTEMGLTLRTLTYVDRNLRLKINSDVFDEIGISCPPLRAVTCKPLEEDKEYHYEVFISFIGLDEASMRKIRRWVSARTIQARKAS
jgi:DNA-binding response OmpR family regulator